MAYAGITANNAVQLFKDFSAAIPKAKLYGPGSPNPVSPSQRGGLPADVGSKVRLSIAVLPPDKYPPEGQQFFKDYAAEDGNKAPDPYAIYGYEGMALQLDAIKRAAEEGKVDKAAVIDQLFATKDRKSVLGTYDRRERRHHAHRLRRLPHQRREARLRQDDQGSGGQPDHTSILADCGRRDALTVGRGPLPEQPD